MGLAIFHMRATLQCPEFKIPYYELYSVTEKEIAEFNVPFSHFSKYIQQIDAPREIKSLIVVERKEFLAATHSHFQNSEFYREDDIIFEKTPEALARRLRSYEQQHALSSLHQYIHQTDKWKVIDYYTLEQKTGFYTEEIGYQRKGLNANFHKRFQGEDISCFATREDFLYAYECLSSDKKQDIAARQDSFRRDFLNQYIEGASYLMTSF